MLPALTAPLKWLVSCLISWQLPFHRCAGFTEMSVWCGLREAAYNLTRLHVSH